MLVDYSDSDSDSEKPQDQNEKAPSATASAPAKPGLSALLPKPKLKKEREAEGKDDGGPRKIVVNLPKIEGDGGAVERPAKRAKMGGGSGLSAMLPAPKKRNGGATETEVSASPQTAGERNESGETGAEKKETEPPAEKKPLPFVPQSVARKPIQPASVLRRKAASNKATRVATTTPTVTAQPEAPMSLFGSGANLSEKPRKGRMGNGEYKPIMLEETKQGPQRQVAEDEGGEDEVLPEAAEYEQQEDFDVIARRAGLDDAAMRQLYGRRGKEAAINLTTFSVDAEYNENERKRQLGLLEDAKPVRSVAPGKHQLQSLLNVARSQQGALEESFAQGKRNRKEAGSKYGW